MRAFLPTTILCLFLSFSLQAQQTSVLFIGNSYIFTENLPAVLYHLALEGGDSIYYESSTFGGYTLEQHSTNATTLAKIASREWDYVVIQEQSQRPSFPDGQVAQDVYPYAEILVDAIKANYECTEPVFFMTWGRRDGDVNNCQNFPPLCTFEGMQERLRNAYMQMAVDNDATVAPCGAAWHQMSVVDNWFWSGLYAPDGSHPSAWGSYLNACIFYSTILRKSPVGLNYYYNAGPTDGPVLQQLAEDMVLDSLDLWRIGHQDVSAEASVVAINVGTEFQFENTSENATDHYWDFGDGNSSTDENPTHTYALAGSHEVMYIASSDCGADTTYLYPAFLSAYDRDFFSDVKLITDASGVYVQNHTKEILNFSVLDVSGRLVNEGSVAVGQNLRLNGLVLNGLNLLQLNTDKYRTTYKLVIP